MNAGRAVGATELVPPPATGRTYTARRRVGLGDVDPRGRARLDALTAYQQDVATADYESVEIGDTFAFVLRRNLVDVRVWPRLGERLELTTWAGGTGSRWAERRTTMRGDAGAHVECAAVWVSIDADGRPVPLPARFVEVYGEAAGGRTVTARLLLPDPPVDGTGRRPWALRRSDIDTLRHVNNAAQWQAVEEVLQELDLTGGGVGPRRAEIEHRTGILPAAVTELAWLAGTGSCAVWLLADGTVATAALIS